MTDQLQEQEGRRTLKDTVILEGIGLHSGRPARVSLGPAPPSSGITFVQLGRPPSLVPATLDHVVATHRQTSVGSGTCTIATIEHLMAATLALHIDDMSIVVSGNEVPILDGSARLFYDALVQAGLDDGPGVTNHLVVRETFTVRSGGATYRVDPAAALDVDVTIDFDHPLIQTQRFRFVDRPGRFRQDLAAARTFGMVRDWRGLVDRGMAKGATRESVIGLTEQGLLAGTQLHWPNEFVRHKVVDLLGDLALLGARIAAKIQGRRPCHGANVELAAALKHHCASGVTPK